MLVSILKLNFYYWKMKLLWIIKPWILLFFYCYNDMRLCLCGTAATNGSIVHFPDDTCMKMEQLWNDIDKGLWENLPLCTPYIPCGMPWKWTWAYLVRRWQLGTCVTTWPKDLNTLCMKCLHWHNLFMLMWI